MIKRRIITGTKTSIHPRTAQHHTSSVVLKAVHGIRIIALSAIAGGSATGEAGAAGRCRTGSIAAVETKGRKRPLREKLICKERRVVIEGKDRSSRSIKFKRRR
ncbi:hypothetical protein G7K_5939-t1 [Saitoella complicata NRRL Y-17804]|uniref:Uncharacterized protein n=1 Tax=Saitoella complicata (strain BCRC 22490 / CBS 7301 / JCM 7358 / NBRC 10748 / NRRL Y-17804) TaxID=698492 RepID=A0A0E9NPV3_SAICN|nr:hypothetical protein G7K_5939-t1 [Saitoella complicata NRRL Y-17804]